jgi:hypothetical protein
MPTFPIYFEHILPVVVIEELVNAVVVGTDRGLDYPALQFESQ